MVVVTAIMCPKQHFYGVKNTIISSREARSAYAGMTDMFGGVATIDIISNPIS